MVEPSPDSFLDACGAAGPLRLDLEGPGADGGACHTFPRPFAVVGRDASMDLVLDHPDVSRRHAYLQTIAGRVFCVDLGSRTGTRWEGRPRGMGWVGGERGVRLGPYRIGPRGAPPEEAADAPPPTSRSFEPEGLPEAILEVSGGPDQGAARWRLSHALALVGKARGCSVPLEGPGVSAFHASLVRTPVGVWVVDLRSGGGVSVNGEPVGHARLDDGDKVRVGGYRIRLRYADPSEAPARARSLPAVVAPVASSPQPLPTPNTELDVDRDAGGGLAGLPSTIDPGLASVLRELGTMQQQMADQFQQALLMMFQMFAEMHRDQTAVIREELARIVRLTEEQKALQAELTSRPSADGSPPVASPPSPAARAPDDIHIELARRIAAIHDERQGRWQRLITSVLGKAPVL